MKYNISNMNEPALLVTAGFVSTHERMATMFDYTVFTFLLLAALIWVYELRRRLIDAEFRLMSNKMFIEQLQQQCIDLGFQLYNLAETKNAFNPGFVYVVKSDSGHYKIGRTVDPNDRMKTFTVKLPMEVEYLMLISTSDMTYLENLLHRQFKHKRVNGEWFDLSQTDLIFLNAFPGNKLYTDSISEVQS